LGSVNKKQRCLAVVAKSNKQINKEAGVMTDDSSPAVVAYRIGQLEKVVKEGFDTHNEKLDQLTQNFATKPDVIELSRRVLTINSQVTALEATNNRQQGAIDANRRTLNIFLTVLSILAVLTAGYIGVMHK
jgi:hypothetical protein